MDSPRVAFVGGTFMDFLAHSWHGKKRVNIAPKSVLYQRFCVYVKKSNTLLVNFCKKQKINFVKAKKAPTAIYRIKLVSDIIKADSYINI